MAALQVQAQLTVPSEPALTGSLGLTYRRLIETAPSGARLLTERGPMLQLQLQAVRPLADGGALGLRGTFIGGDLDYDGQTQAGVPLTTRTRQGESGADLMWRPHAPAPWGEGWLTLGLLANRRVIESTPIAGGLDEVSTAAMAGLRWRSPQLAPASGWNARVEAEARVSVWHRLDVDFYGVLDRTHFEGARKRMLVARLLASPADSPWEWGLEWSGLWQPASKAVGVSRGGAPLAGTTVRQPELSTRDVTLRVGRSF
ncbi:hypothetical protein EZ313_10090 [Ramlibacter henchirensis]|uniref:Uncharacterized protein n=1 Tax=Ramlibacter henchirensis TaxID=204072 RepID=A0A4Z0C5R6_9BURK|nr:hypothetical protein [Ramlibacter henchirensis]TFZ06943.1 hypothetical protein EZ313_10090 [Ramlibacter henchirensis]